MIVEIVAGILANSLALLSDAAHMLTDAGALLLSVVVLRLVRRPARGNVTFGLRRMEILSAQAERRDAARPGRADRVRRRPAGSSTRARPAGGR